MSVTRRSFLKSTLHTTALLSLAPGTPALCRRATAVAATGQRSDDGTALVVVQLSGGNDGLNCVVPYADDVYGRSRTTLRLGARDVLKIDDHLGFHPAMAACRRLYDEGRFSVIQGVGYPKSSRNHPEAERDWQTARPGDAGHPTGWAGAFADIAAAAGTTGIPVAFVEGIRPPLAVRSAHAIVPAVATPAGLTLRGLPPGGARAENRPGIPVPGDATNPLLEHLRATSAAAVDTSDRVLRALATTPTDRYPSSQFAKRLHATACLIRADIGVRLFYTVLGGDGFGGFDSHANQQENHAALLRQFSEGVGAFMDDLRRDGLDDRVLLMTVSEFGRTVSENGRRGTDHGAAAPVFLAGGRLKGGLIGPHPDLGALDNDAPRFLTDFRRVYATMLGPWLGADAEFVLGGRFEPIPCLA